MSAVFADASFYVALQSRRDRHHEGAHRLTESLDGPIVTTAWVLTEVANYFSASGTRQRFLALLDDLEQDKYVTIVPISHDDYLRGFALYRSRLDKDWSLTDCISFLVMEDHGLQEALTADHHFEQAGFNVLLKG